MKTEYYISSQVLAELKKLYNATYTVDNLILSGTHTHGAPGGFMKDVMLDVPNMGFMKETFDALVSGIVRSIKRAHNKMTDARIFLNSGELLEANINRSPAAYLFNPKAEIKKIAVATLFGCLHYAMDSAVHGYTKRQILSDIAKIFDPIEFLALSTCFAKLLMQRSWTL
ncbi:hypothetical protein JTB14_037194 [Gonioctena quinquepunctata]|nr:hypothetical protein JTB14_037194 [Gonioctena quinquepunctata]